MFDLWIWSMFKMWVHRKIQSPHLTPFVAARYHTLKFTTEKHGTAALKCDILDTNLWDQYQRGKKGTPRPGANGSAEQELGHCHPGHAGRRFCSATQAVLLDKGQFQPDKPPAFSRKKCWYGFSLTFWCFNSMITMKWHLESSGFLSTLHSACFPEVGSDAQPPVGRHSDQNHWDVQLLFELGDESFTYNPIIAILFSMMPSGLLRYVRDVTHECEAFDHLLNLPVWNDLSWYLSKEKNIDFWRTWGCPVFA